MSASISQPRLQIKSSKVDDVPTFFLGSSSTSEPLTFCNRTGAVSRPKPFYRPGSSQLRTASSANALFDENDDDDDDDDDEIAMLVDDPAPPLVEIFTTRPREQRENRLMSNSAPEVGLSNRPAPRNQTSSQGRRFDPPATLVCPSGRPSGLVVGPDGSVEVKQENMHEAALSVDNSRTPHSKMFLGVVKDETATRTLPCTTTDEAASSTPSSAQLAPTASIPSIVVTDTCGETKPPPRPRALAFRNLFKRVGYGTHQCLALVHTCQPLSEQLVNFRTFAHHLLQESQHPDIRQSVSGHDASSLRTLRDILKDILALTAIVKLGAAAVQDAVFERARTRCEKCLKRITTLVDKVLSCTKPPSLEIASS